MSWNSTLKRKTPMKRTGFKRKPGKPMQRTTMPRTGKKTREWDNVRARMKVKFNRAGITTCELRREGCWRDSALSYGHSKKRRNIQGREIEECILCCTPCHDRIEILPEVEMTLVVRRVISERLVPVESIFG